MTKWGQHREKKSGDGGPVEYEYDVTEPMVTNQTYFVRACSREEALRRVLEHDDDSIILVEMGFVVPRRPMSVRDVRRGRRLAPRLRDPYPQEGTP